VHAYKDFSQGADFSSEMASFMAFRHSWA